MRERAQRYLLRGSGPGGEAIEHELGEGSLTIGRAAQSGLVLDDPRVSRHHATLTLGAGGALVIEDVGSSNGTFVNGERVTKAELTVGDAVGIGSTLLEVATPASDGEQRTVISATAEGTIVLESLTALQALLAPPAEPVERGVVGEQFLSQALVSEEELVANGVEVTVVPCAAVGGGLGSFVWVDTLRVSGVPANQIAVVGDEAMPHARYQRLCLNSQIPAHERLRSNSDSRPDNIWGFPGYAASEAWHDLRSGRVGHALRRYRQIFLEPAFDETYTPRSGDVFASVEREVARIGWLGMFRVGRVRALRKSREGRLLVIASASDEHQRRHFAIAAQFLHFAPGYPSLQFLPDLAAYREKYGDRTRIVNAYEQHDHVYQQLRAKGGVVVIRGRGIVASRIVQRLWEERRAGADISIVHLHRSRQVEGNSWGRGRRKVQNEWEFQPFNWPKGAWGGEHRAALESASDEERQSLLGSWGGTTTADRRDWMGMVHEGLRDGWYRPEYGVVKDMTPTDDGRVATHISNALAGGSRLELVADYVIDCTGLIASPERSPLIADLIDTYGLPKNSLGRLAVSNDFEIEAMRHGSARMYAAGAVTLGGPFAAVDSFLGLQYAALRAVQAMQPQAPQAIHRLNGMYSWGQWLRWARGDAP